MATQKVVVEGSSAVTASQLKDFFRQVEDRSITGSVLQRFLEHKNPWSLFQIWKTITLGTCKTPDEYRKALTKAGVYIGDWCNNIFGKTDCAQEETEVDLVVLSVKEMGLAYGPHYKDICAQGVQMGLELCPAEVGPALRLLYKDQPDGEYLRIAMKAIINSDGDGNIFGVGHSERKLWLGSDDDHPERFWDASDRFVFLRRR